MIVKVQVFKFELKCFNIALCLYLFAENQKLEPSMHYMDFFLSLQPSFKMAIITINNGLPKHCTAAGARFAFGSTW